VNVWNSLPAAVDFNSHAVFNCQVYPSICIFIVQLYLIDSFLLFYFILYRISLTLVTAVRCTAVFIDISKCRTCPGDPAVRAK